MMTLRCTAALLKQWKMDGTPQPPTSDAATGDWFGNIFKLGRRKYFLFVSAKTLVAVVTRAAPRFPLPEFVPALYQSMLDNGIPEAEIQAEFTRLSPITTAKTNDRRVLGSMNDMVRCLGVLHDRDGARFDPTGPDACQSLWEMPHSLLDMKAPVDALRAALGLEGHAPSRP